MAGALTQGTDFPSLVARSETRKIFTLTINGQLNRARNMKNSVKMAFSTVNPPALIMRNFPGLRFSNALDRALKPEVDFHSRIDSKIFFRRAKPSRLAPKVMVEFERFTKKAVKSLMHSKEEARRLGHDTIGIEDDLLGLIAESSGIGAKVVNAMGITLEDARIASEKISGRRSPNIDQVTSFSPHAYRLLEKAKSLACYNIGLEHLLVAIIHKGKGAADEVLESLIVDLSKIRQEVDRMIKKSKEGVGADVGGGSGESKVSTMEKFGTDLVKVLAEETTAAEEELMDMEIPLKFETVDEEQSRLVLSNRKAMAYSQAPLRRGSVVIGTVKSLMVHSALIDIGGLNGYLPVGRISRERVSDISTVLRPGDTLKVMLLSDVDWERGCVDLSTKWLEPTPGDMICNPKLVFEKAEEMGRKFWKRS